MIERTPDHSLKFSRLHCDRTVESVSTRNRILLCALALQLGGAPGGGR